MGFWYSSVLSGSVMVTARIQFPSVLRSCNNRGQVVHTHRAVKTGTGQTAVMACGCEGNRRSGHASQASVVYSPIRVNGSVGYDFKSFDFKS